MLTVNTNRYALECLQYDVAYILPGDSKLVGLLLVDDRAQYFNPPPPVVADAKCIRVGSEDRFGLGREVPQHVRVATEKLCLDLAGLAGSENEFAYLGHAIDEVRFEVGLNFPVQLVVQ